MTTLSHTRRQPVVLSISSMFPTPEDPFHAQFVKQRLDALSAYCQLHVVSPVPSFPGQSAFRRYRRRARIPSSVDYQHYTALYPRFFSIPRFLKPLEGFTLARAVSRAITQHCLSRHIDLLDCHLGFPDGFAGALLSRRFHRPYVVTLRGHDINELMHHPVRIRQVIYGLRNSSRFFGVAQALVAHACALGAPRDKGFHSPNGVDLARFYPTPRREARARLGLPEKPWFILSVGHLIPRKGVDVLIRMLGILQATRPDDIRLLVVGRPEAGSNYDLHLRRLASEVGVAERVHWCGAVPNEALAPYYSAADLFCLASDKEGWPNVILESLACETPVVASRVWGIPEIVPDEHIGILALSRTPQDFARSVSIALDRQWDNAALRRYAESRSWDATAKDLHRHFRKVLSNIDTDLGRLDRT